MAYKKDHFKRIFVLLKEINNENRKIKGVFVDDYLGNLRRYQKCQRTRILGSIFTQAIFTKEQSTPTEEMIRSYPLPKIFGWYPHGNR